MDDGRERLENPLCVRPFICPDDGFGTIPEAWLSHPAANRRSRQSHVTAPSRIARRRTPPREVPAQDPQPPRHAPSRLVTKRSSGACPRFVSDLTDSMSTLMSLPLLPVSRHAGHHSQAFGSTCAAPTSRQDRIRKGMMVGRLLSKATSTANHGIGPTCCFAHTTFKALPAPSLTGPHHRGVATHRRAPRPRLWPTGCPHRRQFRRFGGRPGPCHWIRRHTKSPVTPRGLFPRLRCRIGVP